MATLPCLPETECVQEPGKTSPGWLLWLQAALLLTTFMTTTVAGMRSMANFCHGIEPLSSLDDVLPVGWIWAHRGDIASGLPFSLTLLAILLAHEFGHYLAARAFRVDASLPFMLPGPSITGTLGAVIRLRGVIRSRRALLVIASSGPIAGFVVALFTSALGLALSIPLRTEPVWLMKLNDPPLLLMLRSLLAHGLGMERTGPLLWHPVLLASWFGLLITSLNLVPAGQLDGGHVLFVLSPQVHKIATNVATFGLIVLGIFVWAPWLLWAALLMIPAMRRPYVVNRRRGYVFMDPQVDRRAPTTTHYRALASVCVVIALLCALPNPYGNSSLLQLLHWYPR